MMHPYQTLTHAFARHAKLTSAIRKLAWDQRVMMPPGGADDRGEELATLSAIAHETITDPAIADALATLDGVKLDEVQAANLREMQRIHAHAAAVPSNLISRRETATARCEVRVARGTGIGRFQKPAAALAAGAGCGPTDRRRQVRGARYPAL